jgi:hypothetical protein
MTRYAPQWIQAASYAASQDRRLIAALWPGPASTGCAVTATTAMTLQIAAGQVAVPSQNNTGTTLCTSDAAEQVTLTASAAQPRIDLITCHPRGTDLDGGTNNDFIFDFVTGTPGATPAVPATPAGQVALAQIAVAAGAASINAANITDVRPPMFNPAAEPATASAAIVSRADTSGEVWVAKAGVNGGAWRKARDALRARWRRAAAFNLTATWTRFQLDTMNFDEYGFYSSGAWLATCPIKGYYRVSLTVTGSAVGVSNTAYVALYKNAVTIAQAASGPAAAAGNAVSVTLADTIQCVAGDTLEMWIASVGATLTGAASPLTYGSFEYVGATP